MQGYGRSRHAPRDVDISLAAQADHLLGWMQELDVERAVLVGHDLGGGVVQVAAARAPQRCAGMSPCRCPTGSTTWSPTGSQRWILVQPRHASWSLRWHRRRATAGEDGGDLGVRQPAVRARAVRAVEALVGSPEVIPRDERSASEAAAAPTTLDGLHGLGREPLPAEGSSTSSSRRSRGTPCRAHVRGRPLSKPRLETTNGTTKFAIDLAHVAVVARPPRITSS